MIVSPWNEYRKNNAQMKFTKPIGEVGQPGEDPTDFTYETGESNPTTDPDHWYWDADANDGQGAWVYVPGPNSDQQGPPLSPGVTTDNEHDYPPGPYDPNAEDEDHGNGQDWGEEGVPPEGGWPWDPLQGTQPGTIPLSPAGGQFRGVRPGTGFVRGSGVGVPSAGVPSASPFYSSLSSPPSIPLLLPNRMSPLRSSAKGR